MVSVFLLLSHLIIIFIDFIYLVKLQQLDNILHQANSK